MKILAFLICIFSLAFLCSITFAFELDPLKFMTVDEIKPGMKGIGKTVFEGTKVDEFQVEILYVDKNGIGPKSDIIWALCTGGPLEETGVMNGMSGSPVYIDGRLIGAVAYRMGSFQKRPIAGITPIAEMLSIFDSEKSDVSQPMSNAQNSIPDLLASNTENPTSNIQNPISNITPIQTPVMMSGFHSKAINDITPFLNGIGMFPVQGGGSSYSPESKDVSLEPGSVIGVEFVKGDMSVFGSGTLTYMDGDKILAFGHPMLGVGKVELPIASGNVGFLFPSMMGSLKYASPAKTVGSMAYDSQTGIMGIIGKQPEFIPVKIRVNSLRNNRTQEYNFEVAKNRLFAPTYIFAAALSAIYIAEKSDGDYTMRSHWEINLKNHPNITKDNIYSGMSPGTAAAAFATQLSLIMQNSFEEVDVENLLLDVIFDDKRSNASMESVQINRNTIRPGDPLELTMTIRPYMADVVTKKFEIVIPKDMPEGPAMLGIFDARANATWEKSRAPGKFQVSDINQLIRQIQEDESNNDIIIQLFTPQVGVTIGDQELPALPLTTFSVMNSPKYKSDSGITRGTTFMKERLSTEYVISGSTMLMLNIDRDAQY